MSVAETIKATVNDLSIIVRAGEDGRDPRITEALGNCEEALSAWRKEHAKGPLSPLEREDAMLGDVEPVLQAANALVDALVEANPEGLPLSYRVFAYNTLRVLEEAEAQGFNVREPSSPKP